jgi:hypothetical protein
LQNKCRETTHERKDCKPRQEQWNRRQRTRETEERERGGEAKWCSYIGLRASSQNRKGFWVRISFPSAKCKLVVIQIFIINLNNNNALKCKPKTQLTIWGGKAHKKKEMGNNQRNQFSNNVKLPKVGSNVIVSLGPINPFYIELN